MGTGQEDLGHLPEAHKPEESLSEFDPLLRLVGSGKKIWEDEPADEYVANLRSNWGEIQ